MTPCEPGSVVLVRFPFTDLRSTKKRPAVVISPPAYTLRHGDVLVLALTSKPQPEAFLALVHWQPAGLLGPTWIKPALFCLAEPILGRQIGALTETNGFRVGRALELLIASPYLPGQS
jgi:mRNA interferase MazF